MQSEVISILRCPEDRSPLREAPPEVLDRVNERIRAGEATSRAGKQLTQPIDSGLVRADGQWLYPILDGIPVLLIDDAISLRQAGLVPREEGM